MSYVNTKTYLGIREGNSHPGDTLLRVGSQYACIDIYFIAD
ncbi:hypothetical protein ACTODO_00071 [Schaalia dentiphila ATCC 17982]|uniref:Uncharacterized protein n=1 Tax=Schaalia dentiphila ATCC 17982 TaxID=411466 RepID=A7B8X2_9ACTO|nr:hypothetical protein ACTODO_00071 [Schaalia odontolytica ATCC 17982]